nr:THAP domain-containing protein 1-like [Parasteatoda tepidariorum]
MPHNCCAYGCTNNSAKPECIEKGISSHRFPLEDKVIMRAWVVALKRQHFEPTVHSKLCSEHFTPDCFDYQNLWNSPQTKRKKIKKDAVPSLFKFKPNKRTRAPTSYTFGASVNSTQDDLDTEAEPTSLSKSTQTDRVLYSHR